LILLPLRFLSRWPRFFRYYQRGLLRVGSYAVLVAALTVLAGASVIAVRDNAMGAFLAGLGAVLMLLVGHYLAVRLGNACLALLEEPAAPLRTGFLADCLGLAALAAALGFLVTGALDAVRGHGFWVVLSAVGGLAVMCQLLLVVLNPRECSNTELAEGPAAAGAAALQVTSFLARSALAMVPFVFALAAVVGTTGLLVYLIVSWLEAGEFIRMGAEQRAIESARLVGASTLFPLLAYVLYVVTALLIECLLAVSHMAGQLRRGEGVNGQ
jgi:hypothetical protein